MQFPTWLWFKFLSSVRKCYKTRSHNNSHNGCVTTNVKYSALTTQLFVAAPQTLHYKTCRPSLKRCRVILRLVFYEKPKRGKAKNRFIGWVVLIRLQRSIWATSRIQRGRNENCSQAMLIKLTRINIYHTSDKFDDKMSITCETWNKLLCF